MKIGELKSILAKISSDYDDDEVVVYATSGIKNGFGRTVVHSGIASEIGTPEVFGDLCGPEDLVIITR